MKLARLRSDPAYCRAALATSALKATDVPQMSSPRGCELHDVERIAVGRDPAFSSSFVASCALAVDLAMFIEHVVAPAAARDTGSAVVTIEHLGSFACRPIVGGGTTTELSQHASANPHIPSKSNVRVRPADSAILLSDSFASSSASGMSPPATTNSPGSTVTN